MSCAQNLFEQGKITYHRTDDTSLSPEFLPLLQKYVETTYGKKAFTKVRTAKKAAGAQEGHECLRVTDPTLTPADFKNTGANDLLCKVYKIIWQRTIASVLPNAVISETIYNIYNDENKFVLSSNELITEGYKAVYSYKDEEDSADTGVVKETFTINEKLNVI